MEAKELDFVIDITPCGDAVLLHTADIKKVGEIIIPDRYRDEMLHQGDMIEGVVVAVGPNCQNFKGGETVLYGKYAGGRIKRTDYTVTLIDEGDIIATVNKETVQ